MGNCTNLFAAKLREVGEYLIKESKDLVGNDPYTNLVQVEVRLELDDTTRELHGDTEVTVSTSLHL